MNYCIREMKPPEYILLSDFLYEAIFKPDGADVPRTILAKPELQVYIKGFGTQSGDFCFCAQVGGRVVGAVWVRIIPGYGSLDDATPEFAISLYQEFRGHGIGGALMRRMLTHLKKQGYPKASLAVQKKNAAFRFYSSLGFQIVKETSEEYMMVYDLTGPIPTE